MTAVSLYYLSQAVAASIYLILAIYTGLARSTRSIQYPFVAFCLIAAFDSLGSFLLRGIAFPEPVPAIMRLRWMAAAFVPALFLHMFSHLQTGRARYWAGITTLTAYTMATVTALIIGLGGFLVGSRPNTLGGEFALEPIFSPSGSRFMDLWVGLALIAASGFLVHAATRSDRSRLRADARRLLLPWVILLAGSAISMAGLSQIQVSQRTELWLSILQQAIGVTAGVLLARGVLRFGSPFGHPLDRRIAPLLIPLISMISADFFFYESHASKTASFILLHLVMPAMIVGYFLARPEILERTARWLGQDSQTERDFRDRLSRAWERLMGGDFTVQEISELLLALEADLQAEFVGLLEKDPTSDLGPPSFGDPAHGPRIVLPPDPIDWPLQEGDAVMTALEIHGLPGQPSLLLPVVADGELAGLLIIGEPRRGGEFSDANLRHAEALTQLISTALTKGVRLATSPLARTYGDGAFSPLGTPLTIYAFGRLQIHLRRGDQVRSPRLSGRARQILAMLLIRYPQAITSAEIMALLWPDSDPESAANNLYVAIYNLRRALQPSLRRGQHSRFIERRNDSYRLCYGPGIWVDCIAFQQAHAMAIKLMEQGDQQGACRAFENALRLMPAPFLDDPALDLPAEAEISRHRYYRMAQEAAQHIVDLSLHRGAWRRAEQALLKLLALNPGDHAARQRLTHLYRQQGMEHLAHQIQQAPGQD